MVNDSCPVMFGTTIGAARAEAQIEMISAEAKPKVIAIRDVNMESPPLFGIVPNHADIAAVAASRSGLVS
jgi:hypothetical protein